jgi:hypothetical protein
MFGHYGMMSGMIGIEICFLMLVLGLGVIGGGVYFAVNRFT